MQIKSKLIPWLIAAGVMATPFITSQVQASIDTDLLAGMKARNIGPAATSGRISDIEAVIDNPNIIYASAASGGVWKSVNAGLNWQPIFDKEDYASIGALAIYQNSPDIIWVGTGEGNVRNSTSIGGGIYKSIDAGKTWTNMGLKSTERINRIALHPTNPNIAYAAALGTLWSENKARGLYKTIDGGKTWQNILYIDTKTGATDIKMDPSNPNKLYASMWEFRRWPYRFESGGAGSGLYVSVDGGETWDRKTEDDGLPSGDLGRITLDISESNPNTVYALAEAEKSALLRSDDGGGSWRKVNETPKIADRPFYYSEIEVDPTDPDTIYNIATFVRRSIDGGKTFTKLDKIDCCAVGNTVHIDNHTLWINPKDPEHLILGNDGGVQITQDAGDSWRFIQNLAISQFYHIRVDNAHPYNIYGGLQDNGSWRGPAETWQSGDGFDAMPFPNDVTKGYSQSQGGFLSRWDLNTSEEKLIMPNPPSDGSELRFNWNAGLAQDPFDESTIYYGSQYVHKSTDKGETWQIISKDLSTNKKAWQRYKDSGGLTPDVTAAENYTAIITIAPSPIKAGVIWVGTDDGRIHVTQDGGQTWKSVENKIRKAPDNAFIPHITPSLHDAGSAYIVFDNHRNGDMKTYVNKAEKFGAKFKDITDENLRGYALSIQQDHIDPKLLFLGTELGLHVSTNAGKTWFKWDQGVPTVSVMDMAIQRRESDLVLGTHGRSIFVIDDYSALRGLGDKSFKAPLKVLSVTDGQQYTTGRAVSSRFFGDASYVGDNEAYGVVLTVMASGEHLAHPDADKDKKRNISLRAKAAKKAAKAKEDDKKEDELSDQARIEVRNEKGILVRTFVTTLKQGVNRIVWRLESDGAKRMPGTEPKKNKDILPGGPEVVPGTYSFKVTLNDQVVETLGKVLIDPRYTVTIDDLAQNYALQHQAVNLSSTLAEAVDKLVESKKDIELIKSMADKALALAKGKAATGQGDKVIDANVSDEQPVALIAKSATDLLEKITALDKTLRSIPKTNGIVDESYKVTNKIGIAWWYVGSTYGKPSPTAIKYLDLAKASLKKSVGEVNSFLSKDLAEFKTAYQNSGLSLLSQTELVVLTME
jgi:photosystem II stability/assembly factor-like uncharacterized protein